MGQESLCGNFVKMMDDEISIGVNSVKSMGEKDG